MKLILTALILSLSFHAGAVTAVPLIKNQGVIWGFAFLSEKKIIFTEREGKIKILNLEDNKVTEVTGAPKVFVRGQGGLLDIELDTDFINTKYLFLTYSIETAPKRYTTALARARLNNDKIENLQELFRAEPANSNTHHFGSRIQFDEKSFLFFTVGERGERHEAQDLKTHLGKVLRINKDGSVPKDNPFYGKPGLRGEIWSYGHRNPQGLFYDRESKTLYEQEHGPRGGDEINRIEKGKNYGWPVITYGREYYGPKIGEGTQKAGMEQPIYQYTPSIAPSGLILYRGSRYTGWNGSFLSGALVSLHLNRLYKGGTSYKEDHLFQDLRKRIRCVKQSPDGFIYFSTDSGEIFKIQPM